MNADLPRSAILLWCEYYLILSSELKTNLMKRMWETLTSTEQTAVVTDLRQFINLSVEDELRTVVEECRSVQPTIENSSTSISFTS